MLHASAACFGMHVAHGTMSLHAVAANDCSSEY